MERIGLAPGSEVGGYRIVAPLGSGGMGAVYRAADGGGAEVALKLLHPHIGADPEARERLRREVSALQRLRHPAVAAVLDAEADSSEAFIVTDLVDGQNLARHVREHGPLDPDALAALARGLFDALDAVHSAGVVHRDLKPSNVVLTADGPVLIDFGIAQGMDEAPLTSTGIVLGTPGYLAPELLDGAEPDDSSDWWGWAAVLAFAATGRDPFGSRPLEGVLARARSGDVDVSGAGPGTARVLRGALDPDRSRRTSPEDVVAGLATIAQHGDDDGAPGGPHDAVPTMRVAEPPPDVAARDGHTRAFTATPAADTADDDLPWLRGAPEGDVPDEPEGDDDDAVDDGAFTGYVAPVPPRRTGSLLALLALAVGAGALAPGVTWIVVAALAMLFGASHAAGSALEARRARRGGPGRGDVARSVLAAPWYLLRGAAVAVPSILVGASVSVVVGGLAWWALDTQSVVVAPVAGGGGTAPSGGNEPWVYLSVVALAMLAGLATLWGGPFSRSTRIGARRSLGRVAPGRSGAVVVISAALVALAIIVTLLATGQGTAWWPLPAPPSLG